MMVAGITDAIQVASCQQLVAFATYMLVRHVFFISEVL